MSDGYQSKQQDWKTYALDAIEALSALEKAIKHFEVAASELRPAIEMLGEIAGTFLKQYEHYRERNDGTYDKLLKLSGIASLAALPATSSSTLADWKKWIESCRLDLEIAEEIELPKGYGRD